MDGSGDAGRLMVSGELLSLQDTSNGHDVAALSETTTRCRSQGVQGVCLVEQVIARHG